eukprot:UN00452
MTAGKSHVFFGGNFYHFLFYATFLPSKSRSKRKLYKRKTQSKKRNDTRESQNVSGFFFERSSFLKHLTSV